MKGYSHLCIKIALKNFFYKLVCAILNDLPLKNTQFKKKKCVKMISKKCAILNDAQCPWR